MPAATDNVIEMVPKSGPASAGSEPGASPADPAAALRRRKAVAIVERYANYSAIGGAIPIPLANAAAITALLVRMVKSLSELYAVPFERNRTRSVVIGLMGGALPTGFATIATSTLSYGGAGPKSHRPCRLIGDLRRVCPQHRSAFHRALRERSVAGYPLYRHALNHSPPGPVIAFVAAQFGFLASAFLSIRSIRLFGRMSVQF